MGVRLGEQWHDHSPLGVSRQGWILTAMLQTTRDFRPIAEGRAPRGDGLIAVGVQRTGLELLGGRHLMQRSQGPRAQMLRCIAG